MGSLTDLTAGPHPFRMTVTDKTIELVDTSPTMVARVALTLIDVGFALFTCVVSEGCHHLQFEEQN